MSEIVIEMIGGNCPVQAEGTVAGVEFYFRARGNRWSMGIGGADVVGAPDWHYEEPYGGEPFAAGWMSTDDALAFIDKAAQLYLSRDAAIDDDGQPDEMREWHDYDQDC